MAEDARRLTLYGLAHCSTCQKAQAALEEAGVIEGYSARLSAAKLGVGMRAIIRVNLSAHGQTNEQDFARFVAAQYLFQHDLEPLYRNEALARLFPGLASRARDDAARADLADLGHPVPEGDQSVREADLSLAEALGWLFVSEGSKLGAAFLFKKAAALEHRVQASLGVA